jgi:hypothetical protein
MIFSQHEICKENPGAYNRFSIAFLFLLSALIMLKQLSSTSYFTIVVEDAFIYPSWAWQFKEALKEGIIYPRWMPLNFWGYGSPTFLLYPPLAYYLVALINVFTDSVIAAMNVIKFSSLFLSGVGIYFLVKEFYSARVALLSAVFCIILPYNIALMYIFGSFAAMVSCLWFSPILLFIHKFFKSGEYKFLIFSGACYGGLLLTHLINAYMFTFVIAAFVICLAVIKKRPVIIGLIPVILLTGFSLSAAYILPVIFEKKFVDLDVFTTNLQGIDYSDMFILPDMTAKFHPGWFWPIYYSKLVLLTTTFCLFILLFLVRSIKYRQSKNCDSTTAVNTFFLLTAVCSILLMFGISSFLWETIPFFKYILFPTRWLHITAFAVSFLSATLFATINSDNRSKINRLIMPLALLSLCLALDLFYITGAQSFAEKDIIPAKAVNSLLEHLPKVARIDIINNASDADNRRDFSIKGRGISKVVSWKSAERVLDVNADGPLVVRFRTFNFPGWTAWLDEKRSEMKTEAGTGAILLDVPRGRHQIKLVFRDTPIRLAGKLISLATAILLIIISAVISFISRKVDRSMKNVQILSSCLFVVYLCI